MSDQHPGRPAGPPPSGGPAIPPPAAPPPSPPSAAGAGGSSGRLPWILAAVAGLAVIALIVGLVVVLSGDDAEAGEVFLEAADSSGTDPFATGLQGDAVAVTTTTVASTGSTVAGATATPSVSGGQRGLYGGTRNVATCEPRQQADFLAANRPVAQAFVDALNADPTLRWSGGTKVSVDQLEVFLLELTPVSLTSDTRVTNHGYTNGKPTPRQAVLQAGTAVLVDRFGVPRVKCNCGNPLTAPTPVRAKPAYRGPQWPGFSPTTVVVVTEVTVQIDVYVLVDVETGDPFSRPAGTTGAEDGDAPSADEDTTDTTETTETTQTPTTEEVTGDQATFCNKWQGYLQQYGDVDPTVPEVVAIFEDLTSVAPAEIEPQMQLILGAVRDAAASGSSELPENPAIEEALFALIGYLQTGCGIDVMGG